MKKLRSYQEEAICNLNVNFKSKNKHLLVMPTGAGKTFTILSFLEKQQKKTLFLAHTREILEQTKKTSENLKYFPLKIMSIQKCHRNLDLLKNEEFEIIIIDECHRSAAKSYLEIIHKLSNKKNHLIGITATPFRHDNQDLFKIFDNPCYSISITQLIEEKYLSDIIGYKIQTKTSLIGVSTKNGDFISSKLSSVINVKNRNELIVSSYIKLCDKQKSLAFCATIKHAIDLKKEFLDKNISCEVIHGKMSISKRKEILRSFSKGEIDVLTNVMILTEGFDEPSITALLMCRPTKSATLYMQMVGRGTRIYENKKNCKVIDFTDNTFDTCDLSTLVKSDGGKITYNDGESILKIAKKVENLIEGTSIESSINPFPIPVQFSSKLATSWQIDELKKRKIEFKEPLTEQIANKLLSKAYNVYY